MRICDAARTVVGAWCASRLAEGGDRGRTFLSECIVLVLLEVCVLLWLWRVLLRRLLTLLQRQSLAVGEGLLAVSFVVHAVHVIPVLAEHCAAVKAEVVQLLYRLSASKTQYIYHGTMIIRVVREHYITWSY